MIWFVWCFKATFSNIYIKKKKNENKEGIWTIDCWHGNNVANKKKKASCVFVWSKFSFITSRHEIIANHPRVIWMSSNTNMLIILVHCLKISSSCVWGVKTGIKTGFTDVYVLN